MTSYILLEVKDEEQVAAFLEHTKQEKALDPKGQPSLTLRYSMDDGQDIDYELIGIYRKPTTFCTCVEEGKRPAATGGTRHLTKGKKYGWLVCKMCGKPPKMTSMFPRNLIAPQPHTMAEMLYFAHGWYWDPGFWDKVPEMDISDRVKDQQRQYNDNGFIMPMMLVDYMPQIYNQTRSFLGPEGGTN